MKKALLILAMIFCSISMQAQPSLMSESNKSSDIKLAENRIGFSGSMISGYLLSYQRIFDPFAIKFSAFYYYYKNGTGSSYTTLPNPLYNFDNQGSYGSFGLELKYYVFKSRYVNLYPFIGGSYWLNDEESPTYYNTSQQLMKTTDRRTNFGGGLGIELIAGKYIAFNFDVGFVYWNEQQTRNDWNGSSYSPRNSESIYFGIGVGGGINFVWGY